MNLEMMEMMVEMNRRIEALEMEVKELKSAKENSKEVDPIVANLCDKYNTDVNVAMRLIERVNNNDNINRYTAFTKISNSGMDAMNLVDALASCGVLRNC